MNPAEEETKNRQTIKRNVVSLSFLFLKNFQTNFIQRIAHKFKMGRSKYLDRCQKISASCLRC